MNWNATWSGKEFATNKHKLRRITSTRRTSCSQIWDTAVGALNDSNKTRRKRKRISCCRNSKHIRNKSMAHIYQTATEICYVFPSSCCKHELRDEKARTLAKLGGESFIFAWDTLLWICVFISIYMLVSLFRRGNIWASLAPEKERREKFCFFNLKPTELGEKLDWSDVPAVRTLRHTLTPGETLFILYFESGEGWQLWFMLIHICDFLWLKIRWKSIRKFPLVPHKSEFP